MPKFFIKISNKGVGFIPVLIFAFVIVLVSFFSITYYQKNEDVLEYMTDSKSPVNMEITVFPELSGSFEINFNFNSPSSVNIENIKKKISSKGFNVVYFCDTSVCITRTETLYPNKITNSPKGFYVNLNVKDSKLKSISIADRTITSSDLKLVKVSPTDVWTSSSEDLGLIKKINRLNIEDFAPTPIDNPSTIKFKISGDGEVFYGFIRNLKETGVSVNECDETGKNCLTAKRMIYGLDRFNTNNTNIGFSVNVNNLTKLVTLNVDTRYISNVSWVNTQRGSWRLASNRLSIENSKVNVTNLLPRLTIIQSGSKFVFTVIGSGQYFNSLMTSLKGGILYTSKTSPKVLSLMPSVCMSTYCEFIIPMNANKIYFRSNQSVNIVGIPSGWRILENNNGIFR